jgi:hypothetical protein
MNLRLKKNYGDLSIQEERLDEHNSNGLKKSIL